MSSATTIQNYLASGGLFNPELMEHEKVRDMIIEAKDEIESLKSALLDMAEELEFWRYTSEFSTEESDYKRYDEKLAKHSALIESLREERSERQA